MVDRVEGNPSPAMEIAQLCPRNRHHTGLSEWRVKVILSASFPADTSTLDGSSLTHSVCIMLLTTALYTTFWFCRLSCMLVAYDYWILIHLFGSTAVQLPTHLALGESIFIERLDQMVLIWSGRVKIHLLCDKKWCSSSYWQVSHQCLNSAE